MLSGLLTTVLAAAAVVGTVTPSAAQSTRFSDVRSGTHAAAIETIAQMAITQGCGGGRYCPSDDVTRAQMASFLAAALSLRDRTSPFADVSSNNVHRLAIGAIAHAGITKGCGDGTIYCPHESVTRGQMASFVARAYDLPPGSHSFTDVPQGWTHSASIGAVAAAGIALGFDDGTFRPHDPVRRDHMASFLVRAGGYDGPVPCPDVTGTLTPTNLGAAGPATAFPITSAVRAPVGLQLHSFDLDPARGAQIDATAAVQATATIAQGRRTWATTVVGDDVYVGQWGVSHPNTAPEPVAPNLFRYDTTAAGDRQAEAIATVPTGGEFWSITADDNGVLYAGTRAHNNSAFRASVGGLAEHEHVVLRIDPAEPAGSRVTPLKFTVPELPRDELGRRPDIKQLVWDDGSLFVGLGQVDRAARLYELDLTAELPSVEEITPPRAPGQPDGLEDARAVFSLAVTDTHIVVGTQRSDDHAPRLIVLDRHEPSTVLLDTPLSEDESRVDVVASDGDRIVATTDLGRVYSTSHGSTPSGWQPPQLVGEPVVDQLHRFVELDGDKIRGISSQGVVWELGPGAAPNVDVARTGAPVGPGLPQSLEVNSRSVVVGANNAIHVRSLADPEQVTSIAVTGESKALTSAADGTVYAATYPFARLWAIAPGGGDAEPVASWDSAYLRPRAAAFDGRSNRVHVLAASDETGTSRLFPLDPEVETTPDVQREGVQVNAPDGEPVDARTIALDPSDDRFVYIGDRRGGIQRLRWGSGTTGQWNVSHVLGVPVRSIEVVDGRVVATYSGTAADGTVQRGVVELHRLDGALLRRTPTQGAPIGGIADGVTLGPVTVTANTNRLATVDRASGNARNLLRHTTNDTFGGPFVAADQTCRLYAFEGRNLFRVPFDARTRLPLP